MYAWIAGSGVTAAATGAWNVTDFAGFSLDYDACMLRRGEERVPLSAREFDVLGFLVANAGTDLDAAESELGESAELHDARR